MFANLEKVMGGTAEKLSNNKVLIAIRDGFLVTTPLIIVASFFILAGNFPIEGYTDFMAQFFGQGWENHMDAVIDSTFSVIALLGGYRDWLCLCPSTGIRPYCWGSHFRRLFLDSDT